MKAVLLGCGALATRGRGYSSLLVEARGSLLLFDCGASPAQSILEAGLKPLDLDCLFLTHTHADHLYSLPILIHEFMLRGRERPITIFLPQPAQRMIESIVETFFDGETSLPEICLNQIAPESESLVLHRNGLKVLSIPVEHGIPTLAYKVEEDGKSLVYAPDTAPCQQLIEFARNADLLFHDATYLDDEERAKRTGHSTVKGALEKARLAGVKKLVLTHLGPEVKETELYDYSEGVVWARDMLSFEI